MAVYGVTVTTEWYVEIEANSADEASDIAIDMHEPDSSNTTWIETYPELLSKED